MRRTRSTRITCLGQLYGWLAICFSRQGASVSDIERMFAKAKEIAPEIQEIADNYNNFRISGAGHTKPITNIIDRVINYTSETLLPADRERRPSAHRDALKQELVGVAA
jgi:hypothetical protein